MKHSEALKVAEALRDYLAPACVRIEIAGSIRRGKPEVKDIELVCIPDTSPPEKPKLEFGKPIPPTYKTQLDELVGRMYQAGDIRIEANGERMKKLYLKYAGIKVDLFVNVPPSQWGVQLVIRTGPMEFGQWSVTNHRLGGSLPDGFFVKHQVVWMAEEIGKREIPDDPKKAVEVLTDSNHLSMPEEVDYLNFLGLGWVEPRERRARWGASSG